MGEENELLEALEKLCAMITRYRNTGYLQDCLCPEYFEALDCIEKVKKGRLP